jgi:hypothetical protein
MRDQTQAGALAGAAGFAANLVRGFDDAVTRSAVGEVNGAIGGQSLPAAPSGAADLLEPLGDPTKGNVLANAVFPDGPSRYGYVSGNPVGNSDPSGLAQFGYRPLSGLPWLYIFSRNPLDDFFYTDLAHEELFFEDGLNPSDVGFFPGGLQSGEDPSQYHMDPMHYDDAVMRQAVANVNPGEYNLPTNNCQTYGSRLRAEYNRLLKSLLFAHPR